jgi:hypothetical protein
VCLTALGIAVVSFAAPAITVVGLKSIAADLGGERSAPAPAYCLADCLDLGERFANGREPFPDPAGFEARVGENERRGANNYRL